MPNLAIQRNRFKQNFNIGDFLSAKIYNDMKGNSCPCGGLFTDKELIKSYEIPCCNKKKCDNNPTLFRINARIEDENGIKKTVSIRHSHDGERLRDAIDVISTLKRIQQEIEEGDFDCRRYDSAISKDSFLFENIISRYIEHYENKVELYGVDEEGISPGTFRKKKTLINLHILPYFTGIDIGSIDSVKVSLFKDSWRDKMPTRNQSLAELKRILNWSHKYKIINSVPIFDRIPKSNERQNVAEISTIREVLPHVKDEYYSKIFRLLDIYPIRPCEIRCLRWKDINLRKRTLKIQRHLSDGIELPGRKSILIDDANGKGFIDYPLTDNAVLIIQSLTRSIDKESLLFPSKKKSKDGIQRMISHSVLPSHWRKACKIAKVPYFEPYEIKHARAGEISENNNGNVKETMDALGHTNINTTMRYLKNKTNLKKVFN